MKKIKIILILSTIIFAAITCKKTPEIPTKTIKIEIGQSSIDSIAYFTSIVKTTITTIGDDEITQYGHCWSTYSNPTIDNEKTTYGKLTQPRTYFSNITNLTNNTTYYIRSFITYKNGTVYGDELELTTLKTGRPTVNTSEVYNITMHSAQCNGDVLTDSGLVVNERGVCWNTFNNVNLENNIGYTINGSGIGSFISNLTGLVKNTTYYVRAYANNEEGTSYGQIKEFNTLEEVPCGELVVNYGDMEYHTVQIGDQCWLKENLNIGIMIPRDQSQTDNGQIEKYCYNNQEDSCNIYGALYQWDEMMNYSQSSNNNPSGIQGICPTGWHVPSDLEWCVLITHLDPDADCNALGTYASLIAGGKMKEIGTSHWSSPNLGATNKSNFTSLPSGNSNKEDFRNIHVQTAFWSSTEGIPDDGAYCTTNVYHQTSVTKGPSKKFIGFPVRCVKD